MGNQRLTQCWKDILDEISEGLEEIDEYKIESLIMRIQNTDRIFLIGAGRSKSVLRSFCIRLNHLGKDAYEIGGVPCPPITPKDMIIASTGSGTTATVLVLLEKAKEIGAHVTVFTANETTKIRNLTDEIISIKAPHRLVDNETNGSKQLMRTLFEQIVFIIQESMISILAKGMPEQEIAGRHVNLE